MNAKPSMLIADDVEVNRAALVEIFKDEYQIYQAADGEEAIRILDTQEDISIALIDIFMPKLDGLSVLRYMQQNPKLSGIPAVANTQYGEEDSEMKALEYGAVDFILKPYNPEVVRRRVHNVVEKTLYRHLELERNLEDTTAELKSLVTTVPGGIVSFELGERITMIYFNNAACELTGHTRKEYEQWLKDDVMKAVYKPDQKLLMDEIALAVKEGRRVQCVFRINRKDGSQKWVQVTGQKYHEAKNHHAVYHAVFLDMDQQIKAQEEAQELIQKFKYRAEHDLLTGIYNRSTFFKKTAKLLMEHPEEEYIIVRWNIERFKVINDLFGTTFADGVLRGMAEGIKHAYGAVGTYGRLEADNFACCIPKNAFDFEEVIRKMNQDISERGIQYHIICNLGIYEVMDRTISINKMCDRARLALNTIKGNYVKRYAVYDNDMRNSLLQEQNIASSMAEALASGEFCVYLQPIYEVGTERPVSAEALARWNSAEQGMISPGLFIPIFEKNGFVSKLDMFVWEEVCKMLHQAAVAGKTVLPVSVNMSRMDLFNPHLCEDIIALTSRYELDPQLLKIEITESAYNDNPIQLMEVIQTLKQNGFSIMMDDFGSGYSSLNMLKTVPVDFLKVDMSFVDELGVSGRAGHIMTSIIRMAKGLDMTVIVEGVENKEQVDFLRSIGCDRIQGYYYSKPLPQKEYERLLASIDFAQNGSEAQKADILDKIDLDVMWSASNEMNVLFNNMMNAMGVYEVSGDTIEVVRVNEGYYKLMGGTPQTLFQDTSRFFTNLCDEDKQQMLKICQHAKDAHEIASVTIRRYHYDTGRKMWINIRVSYLGMGADRSMFYFVLNDVTEQKEKELDKYFKQYMTVLRSTYSEIYELDFMQDTFTTVFVDDMTEQPFGSQGGLRKTFDRICDEIVYPDDKLLYRTILDPAYINRRIEEAPNHCFTVQLRVKKEGLYRWVNRTIIRLDAEEKEQHFLSCVAVLAELPDLQ